LTAADALSVRSEKWNPMAASPSIIPIWRRGRREVGLTTEIDAELKFP
jgi:hypothetical protein